MSDYTLTPAEPTQLVDKGDVFDLGNRSLEVMHVPGRGQGGLAIWESATGSLFTSDMLYDGDHGLAWPPSEPQDYCASLRRFRELPVECVYPGHYGIFDRQRMLEVIDEQLAISKKVDINASDIQARLDSCDTYRSSVVRHSACPGFRAVKRI
jgi:glyoxylase-like metal-dependent hydrolase (beta-lactamase superfamily II)